MKSKYWSVGKFADWVRGTPSPGALTSEGWREWNKQAKASHPWRYWLAEEGLMILQDVITWPVTKLTDLRYYINNRWVSRSNALTAHPRDIKPGQWQDVGRRFLPCLFNELVDFVEVESAWMMVAFDKEAQKKYRTPWYRSGWLRWRAWRSAEAGLAYLDWAASLTHSDFVDEDDPLYNTPTHQAKAAKEIKELYLWWTVTYRNRPDPYEASGWSAYCDACQDANDGNLSWGEDRSPELKKMSDRAHKLLQKMEAAYEKEDEAMMIRLIKVRQSLWT